MGSGKVEGVETVISSPCLNVYMSPVLLGGGTEGGTEEGRKKHSYLEKE